MTFRIQRTWAFAAAALAGAAAAIAGPLNRNWVAPDANWVVHFDVEAMRNSRLGALISREVAAPEVQDIKEVKEFEAFKKRMGFDPIRDLKGVTVYGASFTEDDGVAVITTSPAVETFVERLIDQEHFLTRMIEDERTFYTWSEAGEKRYATLRPGRDADERIVVAGPDRPAVLRALKQLDTTAPVPAPPGGPLAVTPRKGSMLFGSAAALDSIKDPDLSPIFQKTSRLVADFGEDDGNLFGDVTLTAATAADATQVMHVARAAYDIATFASGSAEDLKGLAKAGEWVKVSREQNQVKLRISCSVEQLKDLFEAAEGPGSVKSTLAALRIRDSKPDPQKPETETSKEKPAAPK